MKTFLSGAVIDYFFGEADLSATESPLYFVVYSLAASCFVAPDDITTARFSLPRDLLRFFFSR